jgi:hypothetical protein
MQASFSSRSSAGYLRSLDGVIVLGHDAMAEAVIALSSSEEIAAAHAAVGRALSRSGEKNPILLRLAARHLMAGGDEAGLGELFRGYAAGARQRGDGRASAAIARELLGEEADPARVRHLVGSLPLRARIRMRYVLPAAAIALVSGVAAGFALVRPPAEAPDAMLLSFEIRPLNGNIEVRRHPIFEDRWKIGDSIMASGGRTERVCRTRIGATVYRWAVGPADELVFEGPSPDSGHIDLYACGRSGTVTRLTDTPGDDIHPSWSPDGRFLAFSTARWTPRDDQDADIAVLDPRTRAVRQLTRGSDYDTSPVWSPDGTRIAFARRSAADGAHRLCSVTADGGIERCASPHWSADASIVGWRDPETVAVVAGDSVGSNSVRIVGFSDDSSRVLLAGDYGLALVSPDGRWVLMDDGNVATRQGFEVVPWADPSRARPVARPERSNIELAWAPTPGSNHPLARVRIRPPASSLPPGVTSRLSVEGFDSAGGRLAISPAVLRWSVSDRSLATIDSVDGTLRPLAQGTVVVRVSAGGWREDSLAVRTLQADVRTVWRERWNDTLLAGWLLQGQPVPRVVADSGGSDALLVDGDGYFVSGVVSRTGFEVTRGLGADVRVSTPIRRPKWQRLAVQLIANPKVDEGGIWNDYACGATLPPSEGQPAMTTMQLTAGREYVSIETGDRLRSGAWYTLRVQVFPDGTCGMAIDGKPLWRSRSSYHGTGPLHVAFTGQSVATRILVGPVEVWEGIRGGVDWNALDTPTIARAGARSAVRRP